jgi:hypothetical protein
MRRGLAPAVACALVLTGGIAPTHAGESAAVALAEQAPTTEDQCYILVELCHGANVALDRAERTPWSSRSDALSFRQDGQAELAVDDARQAAEAIERRNGKRLACFDDPECRGILPKPRR